MQGRSDFPAVLRESAPHRPHKARLEQQARETMSGVDSGEEIPCDDSAADRLVRDAILPCDDSVADRLVRDANAFIEFFRKPRDNKGLDKLQADLRQILDGSPLGGACWNSLEQDERDDLLKDDGDNEPQNKIGQRLLLASLKYVAAKRARILQSIEAKYKTVLTSKPDQTLSLVGIYLELRKNEASSKGIDSVRNFCNSLDALSDRSEASSVVVGKLTGNTVHHSMFTKDEFREKDFIRFEFPKDIPPCCELKEGDLDELCTSLDNIQLFLSLVSPRENEPGTQAVFFLLYGETGFDFQCFLWTTKRSRPLHCNFGH